MLKVLPLLLICAHTHTQLAQAQRILVRQPAGTVGVGIIADNRTWLRALDEEASASASGRSQQHCAHLLAASVHDFISSNEQYAALVSGKGQEAHSNSSINKLTVIACERLGECSHIQQIHARALTMLPSDTYLPNLIYLNTTILEDSTLSEECFTSLLLQALDAEGGAIESSSSIENAAGKLLRRFNISLNTTSSNDGNKLVNVILSAPTGDAYIHTGFRDSALALYEGLKAQPHLNVVLDNNCAGWHRLTCNASTIYSDGSLTDKCDRPFIVIRMLPLDWFSLYRRKRHVFEDTSLLSSGQVVGCDVSRLRDWSDYRDANPCYVLCRDKAMMPLRRIVYTMYETDRIKPEWAVKLSWYDEIWVPSTWNKQAFVDSGVHGKRIHVVPVPFQFHDWMTAENKSSDENHRMNQLRDNFLGCRLILLSVFKFEYRKGWDAMMDTFYSAFQYSDHVCFVMRVRGLVSRPEYDESNRFEGVRHDAAALILLQKQLRRIKPRAEYWKRPLTLPVVHVITADLRQIDLKALYELSDVFVLLTRGEGWGLPLVHAMALRVPVVCTAFGGQTAFVDTSTAFVVNHTMIKSKQQYGRCAEPIIEEAIVQIRSALLLVQRHDENLDRQIEKAYIAVQLFDAQFVAQQVAARIERMQSRLLTETPIFPDVYVKFMGPFSTVTGYSNAAAGAAISARKVAHVLILDHNLWYGETGGLDSCDKHHPWLARQLRLMERRTLPADLPYIYIVESVPSKFDCPRGAAYCIGRTTFETDSFPPQWVPWCNRMDEVWVPSAFNLDTLANAGVQASKLHVLPPPTMARLWSSANSTSKRKVLSTELFSVCRPGDFIFLSVFEWSPRKGADVLINALVTAFTSKDHVCLVLKTSPIAVGSRHSPHELVSRMLEDRYSHLSAPPVPPRIAVISENLPQTELMHLLDICHAFVLPTRGEGWGLPIVEAMMRALPVVVTNYSAPATYLNSNVSILLPYTLEPVQERHDVSRAYTSSSQRWAEPSHTSLVDALKLLYTKPVFAKTLGLRGQAWALQYNTMTNTMGVLLQHLSRIRTTLKNQCGDDCKSRKRTFGPVHSRWTGLLANLLFRN